VQILANGDVHFGDGAGLDLTFDTSGLALKGAKFTITNETFGQAGVQILANGDVHFGDGAGNDLTFDSSGLIVGRDVKSPGFDAYNNDTVFYHKVPGFNEGVELTSSGTGVTLVTSAGSSVSSGSSGSATAAIDLVNLFKVMNWSSKRRWKTIVRINVADILQTDFFVGIGSHPNSFIGFETIDGTSKIQASVYADGGVYTMQTPLSTDIIFGSESYIFEIDYTSSIHNTPVDVGFAVNGVRTVISTQVPYLAESGFDRVLELNVTTLDIFSDPTTAVFNELLFTQEDA